MRIIISVILIAAAIAVLFFWGRSLWQDVQAFSSEKASYVSVISRMNQLRKTRDGLVQVYNTIPSQDLEKIKDLIPDTADTGTLVVELSNLANENRLLLKNINARGDKDGVLTVVFSVSGSYENFADFLEKLEKSLRLIDVSKISFSAGKDNFYEFSLEAMTYLQAK